MRRPLAATDRCDRCPAAALVVTVHTGAGELWWCAHHYRQHEADLWPCLVLDQRHARTNQKVGIR